MQAHTDKKYMEAAICHALDQVLSKDSHLFTSNANERTIAARIATYLEPSFQGWNVDVEYNRDGVIPKKAGFGDELELVYPDIIIHRRGRSDNLLVVELKKGESPVPDARDVAKLQAIVQYFGYHYAVFIRLSCQGAGVTSLHWVRSAPT